MPRIFMGNVTSGNYYDWARGWVCPYGGGVLRGWVVTDIVKYMEDVYVPIRQRIWIVSRLDKIKASSKLRNKRRKNGSCANTSPPGFLKDMEIPEVLETTMHLNWHEEGSEKIASHIMRKLVGIMDKKSYLGNIIQHNTEGVKYGKNSI